MQEFALKACIEHFNATYYSVEGGASGGGSTPTGQVGAGVGQQQGSPAAGLSLSLSLSLSVFFFISSFITFRLHIHIVICVIIMQYQECIRESTQRHVYVARELRHYRLYVKWVLYKLHVSVARAGDGSWHLQ